MGAYDWGPGPLMTRAGAYNQAVNGGFTDYFFFELDASYNLTWGTFLGGAGSLDGVNVRYDENDNIFFTGDASYFSSGTATEQMVNPGGGAYFDNTTTSEDISIGKFNSSRALVWHTLYGGSSYDGIDSRMGNGNFITIDPVTDEVIITAGTHSSDVPTQTLAGAYNLTTAPANAGTSTGFSGFNSLILKFTNNGVRNWATYWGDDASGDLLYGSVIVSCNKMIFFGRSWSMTAISATGHYNNATGGQAFLWEVDRSTYSPDWSSYFGDGSTYAPHLAYVDGTNRLFMAQQTYDTALPVTDPGGGAYYDGVHGTGGSKSFVFWELNVVPSPSVTADQSVCSGTSVTLTASGGSGAPYNWYTTPSGGSPVHTGASFTTPSLTSTTTYYVSSGSGICLSDRSPTMITVTPGPSAPTISSNSPVCEGDPINLTANTIGGATYAWTGPNSFSSSSEDPTIASATTAADGTYSCTVTVAGCTSSAATTDVTVNATPSAPTAGSNSPICDGDDINLTASAVSGATYSWTGPNSFASSSQNPTISGATSAADGTYNVTATVAGCTSTSGTVAVTVNPIPGAPTLGSNSPVCDGGTINLTANTIGGATYAWTGPNGFSSSSEDPTITGATTAADGTYSCTVTVAGCTSTAATTDVTINALDDASFSYASGTYCLTGADPTPTISGVTGGTFTIDNSGVIIAGTGEVDLDANGVTSYTVTYTTAGTCPNSSTQSISVTSAPDATFSYTGTPYCSDAGTASVTFGAGASGGVFSSTAGLSINSSTGDVDLAASTPGVYTVSNDIAAAGGCAAASATSSIEVVAVDDPTFAYGASTYCLSGTDPTPTITTSGGSFTSTPAGLTLNGTTGEITLASSSANTYDITYTTGGACPDNSTVQVTVTSSPTAGFSYAGTPYCEGAGTASVTFDPGASAGTFAAVPATTDLVINASTGEVDLNTSVPGTYTVENDIPAGGGCVAANETATITITAQDDASFDYNGTTSFCENETNPVANISGTAGGTFTSTPAGITVDGTTGEIDLSTSTAGASYDITYTTGGTCPNNSTVTITLNESPTAPTAGSTAGSNTICEGESVDITGAGSTGTGVTYSVFDASTGGTNLGSTPLTVSPTTTTTYYVEAFNSNGCGNVGGRDAVTITVNPLPAVDAGADETICPGDNVTLTATGTGSVVWSTTETTPSITVSPTATTTYTVTLTDGNSCENSDDVIVTVQTVGGSLVAVDDSYTSNSGVNETFDVMSNDTQTSSTPAIVSSPSNGTATVNVDGTIDYTSNNDFVGTEAFTYEICDAFCVNICDTATVTITIESSVDFKVPGGFSPNGDNINDIFVITGLDLYPDNKLSIFNRWGNLVYEAAPYNNDWDGTPSVGVLMGDKVTTGTYFYILELGDGMEPLKGSIEIKRD
ncbi:Ig-like domain-containing protein [Parvicella tangerina]|uniref:Immunoglobulin domain-containing protein n=1 Tax=Parvicella tangerina TaxID=2829795 RepID=A0A916NTF5_9FLAO|nr:gliding motility-associated C-terminal domain-containing protein [Parvicella tangerina]CAG5085787.1 hypothetical protein CRYO30217_02885 [Parvicella tangerina]